MGMIIGTVKDLVSLTDWDVLGDPEVDQSWVARIGPHGFIKVMPTKYPREVAIDATLEFLDILRERRYPRDVTDPAAIMEFCAKRARRQR